MKGFFEEPLAVMTEGFGFLLSFGLIFGFVYMLFNLMEVIGQM
jgi:hypothetical protein